MLILDGKLEEKNEVTVISDKLTKVLLHRDQSADAYILDAVRQACADNPRARIEIVTADKQLRKALLRVKPVVRAVVNPVTFWKRYLPRLAGLKGHPRTEEDEDDVEALAQA